MPNPKTCNTSTPRCGRTPSGTLARMGDFVLVISTGGTIACTTDASGTRVPTLNAEALVQHCGTPEAVRVYDAAQLDSSAITLAELDTLTALVAKAWQDPQISGIVLTHGTDSLCETAFALDLVHTDPRPIVITGAQLPADHRAPDGPANLRDAIAAAADPLRRGGGVLVRFAGETLPARGLYKASTEALDAFSLGCDRPLPRPRPVPRQELDGLNVPILRAWPGTDGTLVRCAAASNPDGMVIEALGAGNVSGEMATAIKGALEQGIPTVIATSVPHGAVTFTYGGAGGGAILADMGAVAAGHLSAGQARIALLTALATGTDVRELLGAA